MNTDLILLEPDKIKHLLISLLIFLVIFYVRKYIIKNKWNFEIISSTIRDVLVLWLLKEFADIFGLWNPELKDLLADFYWIFVPIYIYYIYKESKKIENSKFLKYESFLINKLILKFKQIRKKVYILIYIKYRQLLYKKKIFLTLENKVASYFLKKSLKELLIIIKHLLMFTIIWVINIFVIAFKIPFLALVDTFEIISKSISFSFYKLRKMMN